MSRMDNITNEASNKALNDKTSLYFHRTAPHVWSLRDYHYFMRNSPSSIHFPLKTINSKFFNELEKLETSNCPLRQAWAKHLRRRKRRRVCVLCFVKEKAAHAS